MFRTFLATSVIFLMWVSSTTLVHAQDPGRTPLIAEAYFGFGSAVQNQLSLGLEDWRRLLPNSSLLKEDVPVGQDFGNGYGGYSHYGSGPLGHNGDQNGITYLGVGLDMGGGNADAKFQKRLRLGVSYMGYVSDHQSWGRSSSARYDTLVSQSTGQEFYRDTTYSERYDLSFSSSRIGLDVAYVVRRVSASRWAWYLGIGGQIGASFNNEVNVAYYEYHPDLELNTPHNANRGANTIEPHRLGTNLWGAGYALAGIDFALSRKSSFLRNIHLFYELRPTLMISAPAGIPAQLQGTAQNVFGLRFDLR